MFRDKTYLLADGMLFNVTGYRHPRNHTYASLKYVDGVKWEHGYHAACEYLSDAFPEYVSRFIRVPNRRISRVFRPRDAWLRLLDTQRKRPQTLSELHREALQLGDAIGTILNIPLTDFGITDSLLWGEGRGSSDIDLVVFGKQYARNIDSHGDALYRSDGFGRPAPTVMKSPYATLVEDWPVLLARKKHMGEFRGRLFSLRVVLSDWDLENRRFKCVEEAEDAPNADSTCTASIRFHVDDSSEAYCFPAVYRDVEGNELVDYTVVYEGVFRKGDCVLAECTTEEIHASSKRRIRYIIAGDCQLLDDSLD